MKHLVTTTELSLMCMNMYQFVVFWTLYTKGKKNVVLKKCLKGQTPVQGVCFENAVHSNIDP